MSSRWSGLPQRQSLRFVLQAVIPTAIAALVASRTGRAEDVFLPGILYNGALAVLAVASVVVRAPLVGFLVGAALGEPTGWRRDRGLVTMTSRLTLVLAVPYVTRFAVQMPLFLAGNIVALAVAKVALWAGRCWSPRCSSSACCCPAGAHRSRRQRSDDPDPTPSGRLDQCSASRCLG